MLREETGDVGKEILGRPSKKELREMSQSGSSRVRGHQGIWNVHSTTSERRGEEKRIVEGERKKNDSEAQSFQALAEGVD